MVRTRSENTQPRCRALALTCVTTSAHEPGRSHLGKEPIELLAENGDYFRTYRIEYHGGERYPHLELISGKTDVLTEIVKMKAAPVAAPAK